LKKNGIILIASLALLIGLWVQQSLKVDFVTLDEQQHRWSNTNEKWLVVNYFAEWCAPCLREIPELNHFYQQQSDDVAIYAVSFDPINKDQLNILKQKYQIQFPLISQLNTLPWGQPPSSLPTTFILDADGKLQKQIRGELSSEKLLHTINILKGL
jgi:thiol-disulfide isomerase/thioredoxin